MIRHNIQGCYPGRFYGLLLAMASLLFILLIIISCSSMKGPGFVFVCGEDNAVYQAVKSRVKNTARFEDAATAMENAREGDAVLVFASGYPETATDISMELYNKAAEKSLRLYMEYPAELPGLGKGEHREANLERAVVTSDFFGDDLKAMDILYIHDCRYYSYPVENAPLVIAKVAGFDTAVYGLAGTESFPVLFEHESLPLLVATSALSNCVNGRYVPSVRWQAVWNAILGWLQPAIPALSIDLEATVHAVYNENDTLLEDAAETAVRKGADWFFNSRQIIRKDWVDTYDKTAREWNDRVGPMPSLDWPVGDGRCGVLEGFSSRVDYNGFQKLRWWRRADCNAEVAGALALTGALLGDSRYGTAAGNIGDWLLTESILSQGNRADPSHPAYGLIGWNDVYHYHGERNGYEIFYGDDNARVLLGLMALSSYHGDGRWDESIMRNILANYRTAGPLAFRRGSIHEPDLVKNGLDYYQKNEAVSYAPHYQCYLWACYLWAYRASAYAPFLERAKTAIEMTMKAYPEKWVWTNGIQQERARMLLPLAWLVRVEDTPEHRAWLRTMAEEVLSDQDECGAIREEIGDNPGRYGPPSTNEAYGKNEASLIHTNGDPLCDLLYTTNFAFLGLHEAAAATGETYYADAEDRLAGFLCRIQAASESHPELDGAWFRAFDYERWEHWASNADAGWGAWSTETGWTQAWIVAVLAMREMGVSLWDISAGNSAGEYFDDLKQVMLDGK